MHWSLFIVVGETLSRSFSVAWGVLTSQQTHLWAEPRGGGDALRGGGGVCRKGSWAKGSAWWGEKMGLMPGTGWG